MPATLRLNLLTAMVAVLWPLSCAAIDYNNSLALTFDDGAGGALPYRLFLPPGYDQPGATFPLVLFLHGSGERGTNNRSQLAYIDGLILETRGADHPAFLLAPQAPLNDYWGANGRGGFSPATERTLQLISQIEQQYQVDTSRRFVTGLSMGGFGTWDLIVGRPTMFEAAVPMSAYFYDPPQIQDPLPTRVWSLHGRIDTTVPPQPDRATIDAIRQAGGEALYTETAGGHGIWQPVYDDRTGELYDWMFDRVAPPLATWTYDPQKGTVTIDASRAPGGRISMIRYQPRLGTLPPVMTMPSEVLLNGLPVASNSFFSFAENRAFTYNNPAGFTGVLELPGLLAPGMNYVSLMELGFQHSYLSPATANTARYFDIRMAQVPEPSGILLFSAAATVWARRMSTARRATPRVV